jgi:hypothetical protein
VFFQPKWAPEGPRGFQNWDETSPRGPQYCKTSILKPTTCVFNPLLLGTGDSVWEGSCVSSFVQQVPRLVFQGTPVRVCQRCAFLSEVRREECVGFSNDTLHACVCISFLLASHLVVCIDICGPCGPTSISFLVTYIFRRPTFMWLAAHSSFHDTDVAFPSWDLLTDSVSLPSIEGLLRSPMFVRSTPFLVCSGVILPD